MELGINTFGARKRLLMAINQLKSENPSTNEWHSISECKDIPSLLTQLNLERYIRMAQHILNTTNPQSIKSNNFILLFSENFLMHEVDIKMFITLTANDLIELGVDSFAERKRLLIAINQLKSGKFSGSIAVGAERRPSMNW